MRQTTVWNDPSLHMAGCMSTVSSSSSTSTSDGGMLPTAVSRILIEIKIVTGPKDRSHDKKHADQIEFRVVHLQHLESFILAFVAS